MNLWRAILHRAWLQWGISSKHRCTDALRKQEVSMLIISRKTTAKQSLPQGIPGCANPLHEKGSPGFTADACWFLKKQHVFHTMAQKWRQLRGNSQAHSPQQRPRRRVHVENPHQERGVCITGPGVLKSKAQAPLEESSGEPEERYPEEPMGKTVDCTGWSLDRRYWHSVFFRQREEFLRHLLLGTQQSKWRTKRKQKPMNKTLWLKKWYWCCVLFHILLISFLPPFLFLLFSLFPSYFLPPPPLLSLSPLPSVTLLLPCLSVKSYFFEWPLKYNCRHEHWISVSFIRLLAPE